MSEDWIEDCLHWRGKVLTGKYGHWCPEWDYLPIDETCEEWGICCEATCKPDLDKELNRKPPKVRQ